MSRRKEIADALRRSACTLDPHSPDVDRLMSGLIQYAESQDAVERGPWIADALDRASDETEASIADVPWWWWVEKRQARIAVGYMRTLAHYIRNPSDD
jgi:hypothetical protein